MNSPTPDNQPEVARPSNGWVIYRTDVTANRGPPGSQRAHATVSSATASSEWKAEAPEVVGQYERLAAEVARLHKERFPDYRFAPENPNKPTKKAEAKKSKKGKGKARSSHDEEQDEYQETPDQSVGPRRNKRTAGSNRPSPYAHSVASSSHAHHSATATPYALTLDPGMSQHSHYGTPSNDINNQFHNNNHMLPTHPPPTQFPAWNNFQQGLQSAQGYPNNNGYGEQQQHQAHVQQQQLLAHQPSPYLDPHAAQESNYQPRFHVPGSVPHVFPSGDGSDGVPVGGSTQQQNYQPRFYVPGAVPYVFPSENNDDGGSVSGSDGSNV